MHGEIIKCDHCGATLNRHTCTVVDGGEFGYGDVCKICIRYLESGFTEWQGTTGSLDINKFVLPIRVSNGVRLLQTISEPHWYFLQDNGEFFYETDIRNAALGQFAQRVERVRKQQLDDEEV